jgi:hypothetical protein
MRSERCGTWSLFFGGAVLPEAAEAGKSKAVEPKENSEEI